MRVYDRVGFIKDVMEIFNLLWDVGWVEEMGSYGMLLYVYLKCNFFKEVLWIFLVMCKVGMVLKEYMCCSLICIFRDVEMFDGVKLVFKEM